MDQSLNLQSKQSLSQTANICNQSGSGNLTQPFDNSNSSSLSRTNISARASLRKQSGTLSIDTQSPTSRSTNVNKYLPSKVFINRCQSEVESLIESVGNIYHSQIKDIYNEEDQADLFIHIGEEFVRPLHRCLLVSRAYKLYSNLSAFKAEKDVEEDIIVSNYQSELYKNHETDRVTETKHNIDAQTKTDIITSEEQDEELEIEAPPIIHYIIPDNLVSAERILSFVRSIYLDQDTSSEENSLNRDLLNWIKLHKPEIIRPKTNFSPDHRESFRTIQPDFEDLSIGDTSAMSPEQQIKSPVNSRSSVTDHNDDTNTEDLDDSSQIMSIKDESMTGSLLVRTETFELISKASKSEDLSINVDEVSKNPLIDTSADEAIVDESGDSEQAKVVSNYAPTTRTGLKPRKFTTPVGLLPKTAKAKPTTNPETLSPTKSRVSTPRSSVSKASPSNRESSSANPQATRSQTKETTAKAATSPKTKAIPSPQVKSATKPALSIARAQPISLERSQSPGISLTKGKNFITANKRFISQLDKKSSASSPNPGETGNGEVDVDATDEVTSSIALEPLLFDNLAADSDKFALISVSKLAESLARIFIDQILTDSIVVTKDGRQINAHRCILAARSPYLNDYINKPDTKAKKVSASAEFISQTKQLTESNQTKSNALLKIDLSEFSYSVVYFCLLHIYSGIVKVPDDMKIEELTQLTHLLHVSTLRQVCQHNLRMNLCHFFHKPCQICCQGVLKTLPLAWLYDYTDLYTKCLNWIGSNFASIFCLREFAELKPNDLIEECYAATMSQLTPDNIIGKTIECQKLLKNLPRVKWTDSIICLIGRLLEDFCHYVADNYEKILRSESFLNLGKSCWECEVLEENLLAAMNHLKPDSGCKTLTRLREIECSIESFSEESRNVSDSFANLISKMCKYCERYLLKEAAAVVHCSSWRHMSPSLQKRIKDQAVLSTDFDEPTKQLAAKPKPRSNVPASGIDGSKSPGIPSEIRATKSPNATYLPPPKNKTVANRHVKVLK